MDKKNLYKNIQIASGKKTADFVIKNCQIVNVLTHEIEKGDIAISGNMIVGVGSYDGIKVIDAEGKYAIPGLIDSHVHIESSFLTPSEFGRAIIPHGVTTVIADPHEIVNVCGMDGFEFMLNEAKLSALDILLAAPSCVPCTEWEHNGAVINADDMRRMISNDGISGVGEFMNAHGILSGQEDCLDKLQMAWNENVIIDGHSPGLVDKLLSGYIASGIKTDHECSTIEEMNERLKRGLYVELRYGSATKDLVTLIKGVNQFNSRRCLLCSDDLQAETIIKRGDIDACLKVCVENEIDPITAVQMATLNAAECYRLYDRGAIAPTRRADILLVDDLKDFNVRKVFIAGELVAEDGQFLKNVEKEDISKVKGRINVRDFSESKLRFKLQLDSKKEITADSVNENAHKKKVHVIGIRPGSLVTDDLIMEAGFDDSGDFIYNKENDIARISVIERHKGTGNVANALIHGYGIKSGAVAVSVGHDSHNILTVGVNTSDMYFAVMELIKQNGGIVLAEGGQILERLELPVAGLMSTLSAFEVARQFEKVEKCAINRLKVCNKIDPIMTLCFMSLPVIPTLKITDMGLFDVSKQEFIQKSL